VLKLKLLSIYLGRKGGGNHYSFEMTKALSGNKEIEHAFIFSNYSDTKTLWETIPSAHLSVNTYRNKKEFIMSYIGNKQFRRIKSFIDTYDPDIVYYPMSHFWKYRIDQLLSKKAKVVLTIHDPTLHEGEDNYLMKYFEKKTNRRMDKCVVLSPIFRDVVCEKFGMKAEDVIYLPHGNYDTIVKNQGVVDLSDISADIDKHNYFLFTGRFVKYKGLSLFLRAVKELENTRKQFVIAGNGILSKEETELIHSIGPKKLVLINRWLSDAEINTLIKYSYYLVLTHTTATQSGLIPLAYTLGVPVISSDAGGLKYQVEENRTGFLFQAGNLTLLKNTIQRVDEDQKLRQKIAAEVTEYSKDELSWEKISKKMVNFALF